jgi:hypothetical protein
MQGHCWLKSTNQIVLLYTRQDLTMQKYAVWLVIVSLDSYESAVFELNYESIPERKSVRGFHVSTVFDFCPTTIGMNHVESSFVLYGRDGCCVGNLPSEMSCLQN